MALASESSTVLQALRGTNSQDTVAPSAHTLLENLFLFFCKVYTPCRGVQPAACGPHAAQDGYECSPTQNYKFT